MGLNDFDSTIAPESAGQSRRAGKLVFQRPYKQCRACLYDSRHPFGLTFDDTGIRFSPVHLLSYNLPNNICAPTQMPMMGRCRACMRKRAWSKPDLRNCAITVPDAPTPGIKAKSALSICDADSATSGK